MKLASAIQLLASIHNHIDPGATAEELNALKLGIEALKAWKYLRDHSGFGYDTLLPGETKEERTHETLQTFSPHH